MFKNKTLLSAVSVAALMISMPAIADSNSKPMNPGSEAAAESSTGSFTKDAERAWENTKSDVSKAADNAAEATQDAYRDVKATLIDNNNDQSLEVRENMTASGMIGEPVYNQDGERVAKVRDIILDNAGNAKMIVLADGEFTGLGKLVAFDYSIMTEATPKGDMMISLTEEMIDNAASFSYDRDETKNSVKVIPNNGYSASELMDAQLVNAQGDVLGNVDNITLKNGKADHIIIGFNQTLGLGGETAALNFTDAQIVQNDDQSYNFQLSANKAQQFEKYKQNMTVN